MKHLRRSLKILSILLIAGCSNFPKMNNYAINGETQKLICNKDTVKDCKDLTVEEANNYIAVSPDDLEKILACTPIKIIFLCSINGINKTLICYRESDDMVQILTVLQANNYFSVHPDDYNKLLDFRKKKCEDSE